MPMRAMEHHRPQQATANAKSSAARGGQHPAAGSQDAPAAQIIECKKKNSKGETVVTHRYRKGRLLGKVCNEKKAGDAECMRDTRSRLLVFVREVNDRVLTTVLLLLYIQQYSSINSAIPTKNRITTMNTTVVVLAESPTTRLRTRCCRAFVDVVVESMRRLNASLHYVAIAP